MNIYVHEKGIILTGKAWEVVQKLKEYANHFHFVSDWVESLPGKYLKVKHDPSGSIY